ncbi:unnamed protein product [Candida verbasci]|uniref:Survival protein SurE-like phosphatase/nucleotidase domain-containing protein n=1 Tax=Candida verbasci TaxID=1227364 RepID=A0A9W4TY49_9ASCO|nr:unnamed protein product [Candida verbasci]
MRIIVIVYFILSIYSLNILLTTTDSWVSKDIRFLYSYLKENNHNVLLMAPLYENNQDDLPNFQKKIVRDGGEFAHLLPVHQTYFKKLRNLSNKGAKNVIKLFDSDFDPVLNTQYGQDSLDEHCWYINSSPMNALRISLDILIPTYYPDFKPDLVLVGPNQGLNSSSKIDFDNFEKYSLVSISLQDKYDLYYQNEKYFNIGWFNSVQLMKHNTFTKNIKFINKKILNLINSLDVNNGQIKLDIKFPSLNHDDSHCITSAYSDLSYKQIDNRDKRDRIADFEISQFELLPSGEIKKIKQQEEEDNEEDNESSREYASFKFNNDRYKQEIMRLPKRTTKKLNNNRNVYDYILSNCNIVLENLANDGKLNYEEIH